VSVAGGKKCGQKNIKEGEWDMGEMEQYHRQLLIPVAIETNSMVALVLVKKE